MAVVGTVTVVTGHVVATHTDGSRSTLAIGSAIAEGDVVETGDGAAVNIVCIDDTTLSMGESSRLVIDKFVYDPAGESSAAIDLAQGFFVLVTGALPASAPDAFVASTPVATIGIRGTGAAILAAPEGERNLVSLLVDPDGHLGELTVRNEAGTRVLDEANEATAIQSQAAAPSTPFILSEEQLADLFQAALDVSPYEGTLAPLGEDAEEIRRSEAAAEARAEQEAAIAPQDETAPSAVTAQEEPGGPILPVETIQLSDGGGSGTVVLSPVATALSAYFSLVAAEPTTATAPTEEAAAPSRDDEDFVPIVVVEPEPATPESLAGALLASLVGSGVGVVAGSVVFRGTLNPSASQFSSVNLGTVNGTIFGFGSGILLTTGDGEPPSVPALVSRSLGLPGDPDLENLLLANSLGALTFDATSITLQFTVPEEVVGIEFVFMFGSEEFPSTAVPDIAGVFVDGQNFLFFPDGGLVRFDPGLPIDPSFFSNGAGTLSTAYNGVSAPFTFAAFVDPDLEVHTLKIAIADTNDSIIDSGLFIRATSVVIAVNEIVGTAGADHLVGGSGRDVISGRSGNDRLEGGVGDDDLLGESGTDTLLGQAGNDSLAGGPGNDLLVGGADTDTALFFDATGPVQVDLALVGPQSVGGGLGLDELREIEDLSGGPFGDVLRGDGGINNLQGREGNDSLLGGGGDDVLFGDEGRDQLFGEAGNDFLVGGPSGDSLAGGPGADFFAFEEPSHGAGVAANITIAAAGLVAGVNFDRILDFSAGQGDLVGLSLFAFDLPEGFAFLVDGTNFSTISVPYNGTNAENDGSNAAFAAGNPALVFSTADNTLVFDPNGVTPGYTVLAEVNVALGASDIATF